MVRWLVLLLMLVGVTGGRGGDGALVTVGEASGFVQTARLGEVESFLARLADRSPLVRLGTLGWSFEDRAIPLAILADPPVNGAGEVGDRLVVLLMGSIHAGEICGKEALLMLARDIAAERAEGRDTLLDHLVLCFVPVYNADGNERVAPDNRPGQAGPVEMGIRENAQGLDLNRDWVKMDAPETRAMVAFLNAWDPAVIVDTHTTNGSNHRFTMTYQGPKHPAGDPRVIEFVRDIMLPVIDRRFEAATGYHAFFYGNFEDRRSKWTTFPAEPWYGVAYRGLRNRLSILTEAYAYAPFEDRVRSTEAFCREILRFTAERRREISDLITAADRATIELGLASAPLAVHTAARAFAQPATILGYEEPDDLGAHGERADIDPADAAHRDYTVSFYNDFVPTLEVNRPAAYLVPAAFTEIIDRLRAHGVRLETAGGEGIRTVAAEIYTIESVERNERPWQNRTRMQLCVALEPGSAGVHPGDTIVRTDQPLGSLAAYMLEPQATGGFAAWGFFGGLASGGAYPIARLDADAVRALGFTR
jgi:hypothetical protein